MLISFNGNNIRLYNRLPYPLYFSKKETFQRNIEFDGVIQLFTMKTRTINCIASKLCSLKFDQINYSRIYYNLLEKINMKKIKLRFKKCTFYKALLFKIIEYLPK